MVELFAVRRGDEFRKLYRGWAMEALKEGTCGVREARWTESIAAGGERFITDFQEKLGPKGRWREIAGANGSYELRESRAAYDGIFGS